MTWDLSPRSDVATAAMQRNCHLALSYPYTLSWSVLEALACGAKLR